MKNSNKTWKKIVTWKKKPNYNGFFSGFLFFIFGLYLYLYAFSIDSQVALLSLIFGLMSIFGIRLAYKSAGEEREVLYISATKQKIKIKRATKTSRKKNRKK